MNESGKSGTSQLASPFSLQIETFCGPGRIHREIWRDLAQNGSTHLVSSARIILPLVEQRNDVQGQRFFKNMWATGRNVRKNTGAGTTFQIRIYDG